MAKQDDRISKALIKWLQVLSKRYKELIREADIRYTGELEDLMSYGVTKESDENILSAAVTFESFLILADEWKYVEDGRLAGSFPNLEAMLQYVRLKPVIPIPYTLKNGQQRIPTENQLAYLIGRKIERDGIAPNPLLQQALDETRLYLIELLNKAVSDAVRDQININFKL